MANPQDLLPEPSDSSPLLLEQLSDDELKTIILIERRLYLAQQSAENQERSDSDSKKKLYLAPLQVRFARVLLLDGSRGTGKTSMLLTLVHRWSPESLPGFQPHNADAKEYKSRVDTLRADSNFEAAPHDFDIPKHVQVVGRILDFDPLPPEMPLIAGIIQAWQPLAEHIDERTGRNADCDEEGETLMDLWHRLFRVAAVGFAPIPQHRGLIEQVLDRQEQVQDWQRLEERWHEFVDEVIKRGKCVKGLEWFNKEPVFVIMIDDCDLQVGRIRELVPALRMLYHPNVFFIVAADQRHMTDMLSLSFYGQQNKVAQHQNALERHPITLVETDRWAVELAVASVNKAFPLKNRWSLRRLSLHELLNFPRQSPTKLKQVLNGWTQQNKQEREWGALGTYLDLMAGTASDSVELPPIMSYRAAHQIVEQALAQKERKLQGLEVIRHILGGYDSENLVRVPQIGPQTGEQRRSSLRIEYRGVGELSALFHEGFREQIGDNSAVVLSARPDFLYRTTSGQTRLSNAASPRQEGTITSVVIAASLREDGFGVISTGLDWNIRLALAWTEGRISNGGRNLDLAFQWQVHVHPSPLQLLLWSRDWRDFIDRLQGNPTLRLERIGYAWIYYQLKWLRQKWGAPVSSGLKDVPAPFGKRPGDDERFNESGSWQRLLSLRPETGTETKYWTRRMQLLARPELGMPVEVQEHLLATVSREDAEWLWYQRRRLITDAIVAAADKAGIRVEGAEDDAEVNKLVTIFEKRDEELPDSPWWRKIEKPRAARRRTKKEPE
jgi:hypothetical protein